jgi:hypothetical protein
MNLDHGGAGRDRIRAIDLDFVVVLRAEAGGKAQENYAEKCGGDWWERTRYPRDLLMGGSHSALHFMMHGNGDEAQLRLRGRDAIIASTRISCESNALSLSL